MQIMAPAASIRRPHRQQRPLSPHSRPSLTFVVNTSVIVSWNHCPRHPQIVVPCVYHPPRPLRKENQNLFTNKTRPTKPNQKSVHLESAAQFSLTNYRTRNVFTTSFVCAVCDDPCVQLRSIPLLINRPPENPRQMCTIHHPTPRRKCRCDDVYFM